jgi:hypothetical protein
VNTSGSQKTSAKRANRSTATAGYRSSERQSSHAACAQARRTSWFAPDSRTA